MGSSDSPELSDRLPPEDLLPVMRRSGILTPRQFKEVRVKILAGEYPCAPTALAERLVEEKILTGFQARRLLRNKAHGLVIGRYVILDRLGSGSMGRVFKAQHQLMGRVVALKLIAPRIASRVNSVLRFHREMRLIGQLDHPNVIRAFDADQVGDVLYIVMEYVAGQSLDHLLETRGPLPPAEVVDYAVQAALGLGHAHDQGIIHRDVKPSNLLVSEGGQVKVLDLGLGTLMEADSQASFATAAGAAVGTIDYMSPEQAIGRDLDGRSDLFSLGCTMYYLLTARIPFPGDSALERLGKRVRGQPIPITDILPNLPPRLVQAVGMLLARRPEDRFQTAAEAAATLNAALDRIEVAPSLPRATPLQKTGSLTQEPEIAAPPSPAPEVAASPPRTFVTFRAPFSWARLMPSPTMQSAWMVLIALIVTHVIVFVVGFVLRDLAAIAIGWGRD